MSKKRRSAKKKVKVKMKDIRPSRMLHAQLTPAQETKARDLYERLARYIFKSFEELERLLCCDVHPDRELAVMEAMAETVEQYQAPKGVERKQLVQDVYLISLGEAPRSIRDRKLVRLYQKRLRHHLPPDDDGWIVTGHGNDLRN